MRLSWRRHGRDGSSDELQEAIVGRFECKKVQESGGGGKRAVAGGVFTIIIMKA